MKKNGRKRGVPIGAYTSQPIGNFASDRIAHRMKEEVRVKCYLQYCDDTVGLARTKAEAWKALNAYERMSAEAGFVVKASAIVAPIAERTDGKKRKRRKRQRGHRRKTD